MADIKVIKVDADGLYEEHNSATDSIKVLSLKTENNELTDEKLGALIGGGDASSQHNHASLYFDKSEYVDVSTGVADAAKPIKTDDQGKIDLSFLPSLAHDDLDGVANSTAHLAFPLLVGGRDFTAIQKYDSNKTFTLPTQIIDKKYADDLVANLQSGTNWLQSINEAAVNSAALVGTPIEGYRVLINGTGVGAFAGHNNAIATYVSGAWTFVEFAAIPVGSTVREINTDKFYLVNPSNWSKHAMESTVVEQNGPLFFSDEYELDLATKVNGGLKIDAAELAVDVGYLAGDGLKVEAGDKFAIDFSTALNDGKALKASDFTAANLPIVDAGNLLTASNGEAAFQELAQKILDEAQARLDADTALGQSITDNYNELTGKINDIDFPEYEVGVGGVTQGHPVYISAAGVISKYSDLSSNAEVIGVAVADAAEGANVKVVKMDRLVDVTVAGTAGARLYWTGTAFSVTMPTTAGANVWMIGMNSDAGKLGVNVRHIKKNAGV